MKKLMLALMGLLLLSGMSAQQKVLTMEEAVLGYELYPERLAVQWQGETNAFTFIKDNRLMAEDAERSASRILMTLEELSAATGEKLVRWPSYTWVNGQVFGIQTNANYTELDVRSKKAVRTIPLPKNARNLTYNRKDAFAFTRANNLYYSDERGNEYAVTADSDPNLVNGQSVSRSEMGITNGIFWSPDGKKLAFYRKDESAVSTFPLLDITSRTGTLREIKYPMAGMASEQVSLGIYDLASGKTVFVQADDFGREQYLTNISWSPASDLVYIQVVNRDQKHIRLNKYCARTGAFIQTLLEEQHPKFVEPQDKIIFLENDPSRFIYRTDNRHGYRNLYLCDTDGKQVRRLTVTDADVAYAGQDGKYVYYTSAEVSPVENHLFRVELKTGRQTRLTRAEGWHAVSISRDGNYFLDTYSSLKVPNVVAVQPASGKPGRELLRAADPMADYNCGEIVLGTVKSADGQYENYYRMVKPMNFDPNRKYPAIVYVYGGPHSQMVKNSWQASLRRWEMYMAQHGYVLYIQDNRGTSNRGAAFEKAIHGQCGQAEMADQLKGVEFLKSHSWVDADRIGVHGWSYGGFMTISLITNYPDLFKVAVAGGPVIDWKWYEVMYGERYMDSPRRNPEGYARTSLMNKAKDLKGKLLICQGAIDNTVLWQHSLNFIQECIRHQVQVDYFPYPVAEHNVAGRDRIHLMQKVTDYFEDYL